jgi:hypothetical protein
MPRRADRDGCEPRPRRRGARPDDALQLTPLGRLAARALRQKSFGHRHLHEDESSPKASGPFGEKTSDEP